MNTLWLAVALALCASCAAPQNAPQNTAPNAAQSAAAGALTADAVAQAVLRSQSDGEDYTELPPTDTTFTVVEAYGLTDWTDAAVYTVGGMDAREVAVVRVDGRVNAAADALETYRQGRHGDFYGYAPEQAELVKNGGAYGAGDWVALLLCSDPDAAVDAFDAAVEGGDELFVMGGQLPVEMMDDREEVPFDPPNKYDMTPYDTIAVILAWESGERDWLGEKDAAILARSEEILAECITEGMSDFEKELAIHDYLLDHMAYDRTVYHNETPLGLPDNQNPYGALVGGYGICLGYSTAFQLLLELSEVECVTVVGAAHSSGDDHAWNMVKLEGEWYCVDVTWDDPTTSGEVDSATRHRYFNVTSEQMRNSDHQWDYENTPEATATRFRWDGTGGKPR